MSSPEMISLRKQAKIEYVWDDHDYNLNNGGSNNPLKQMMFDILKR
jgi:hypothetical protein